MTMMMMMMFFFWQLVGKRQNIAHDIFIHNQMLMVSNYKVKYDILSKNLDS